MTKRRGSPRRVIRSPISDRSYRLHELLGEGGFGQVWRCDDSGRPLCIKITDDQESWHREAYMAGLVGHHPNVVTVLETFPLIERSSVCFAVVMELMERGTVEDEVAKNGSWPESRVVRALHGLLAAVDLLHRGGAIHRDITPKNVFVDAKGRLKLGDFGIATHAEGAGAVADAFAPWFVDTRVRIAKRLHWDVRDDLWQIAQLATVLVTGEVKPRAPGDMRWLSCSDRLKFVIARATGERWSSFSRASDMAAALRGKPHWRFSKPRRLAGRNVVFTGKLSVPRRRASHLARMAGATVQADFGSLTDTLVVGTSGLWAAGGAGGRKLIAAEAAIEAGRSIAFVSEDYFVRLVSVRHTRTRH